MNNQEILDLWESILDDNDITDKNKGISFPNPEIRINGSRYGASNIWYECQKKLECINEDEKLQWLEQLIIKQYIGYSLPLLHIQIEDILNGKTERIEKVKELLQATADSDAEKIWKEKQNYFIPIAAAIGITLEQKDINDPVSLATILLEAGKRANIKKIRSGKKSKKDPVVSEYIYSIANEERFVKLLEQEKNECCLVMAHIRESEKNGQRFDGSYDSNFCFGVKDGENIYLVYEFGKTGIMRDTAFYEGGKRTSYMPYQLFFENAKVPKNSTFLSLSDEIKSWHLPEILDQEQKIFFPVFISTIIQKTVYEPAVMKLSLLKGETEIHFQDGVVMLPVKKKNNIFKIKSLEDIVMEFSSDKERMESFIRLMNYFAVKADDLDESKLVLPAMDDESTYEEKLRHGIYEQLKSIVTERIYEFYYGKERNRYNNSDLYIKERTRCQNAMYARYDLILGKIISGELDNCTTISIHKSSLFTEEGKPVCARGRYVLVSEQIEQYNSVDDGRLRKFGGCAVYFPQTLEGKLPPVKITIDAVTDDEITALTGFTKEEFPEFLKIRNDVNHFFTYSNHNCNFPVRMYFCMNKKEYKKYFNGKYITPSLEHIRGNGKRFTEEDNIILYNKHATTIRITGYGAQGYNSFRLIKQETGENTENT